jgi:hypothetical protein
MPDDAAGTCPEQPVVTGKMPCETADGGAFQATFGRRRGGTQRKTRYRHGKSCGDQYRFHLRLLVTVMMLPANTSHQLRVPAATEDRNTKTILSNCKWKAGLAHI